MIIHRVHVGLLSEWRDLYETNWGGTCTKYGWLAIEFTGQAARTGTLSSRPVCMCLSPKSFSWLWKGFPNVTSLCLRNEYRHARDTCVYTRGTGRRRASNPCPAKIRTLTGLGIVPWRFRLTSLGFGVIPPIYSLSSPYIAAIYSLTTLCLNGTLTFHMNYKVLCAFTQQLSE